MLSLSFVTGSSFWLLKTFAMQAGDFGPESHFLQYPALQLHGFAAFLMMMCLGAIFGSHIPKNWHYKRGKNSGIAILSVVTFSVISAYSLYYLVSEDFHTLLANSHAIVGITLPVILFIHITLARKAKGRKTRSHHKDKHRVKQKVKHEKKRIDKEIYPEIIRGHSSKLPSLITNNITVDLQEGENNGTT